MQLACENKKNKKTNYNRILCFTFAYIYFFYFCIREGRFVSQKPITARYLVSSFAISPFCHSLGTVHCIRNSKFNPISRSSVRTGKQVIFAQESFFKVCPWHLATDAILSILSAEYLYLPI